MSDFRFENLEIWKEAIQIALLLFEIGDKMHDQKLWRFADQIHGVGMSISNNICESTGTIMINEQRQFLRYAKRESYEAANTIILLELKSLITSSMKAQLYNRLNILSGRIQAYANSLK